MQSLTKAYRLAISIKGLSQSQLHNIFVSLHSKAKCQTNTTDFLLQFQYVVMPTRKYKIQTLTIKLTLTFGYVYLKIQNYTS